MRFNVEYFDQVVLGHSLFRFDAHHERLVDMEQTGNFLRYDQMKEEDGRLRFTYDERNRCIFTGPFPAANDRTHLFKIALPIGMARLSHEQDLETYDRLNYASREHGYGFQMLGELYVSRTLGIKPKIELPGKVYYLHTDTNMLGSSIGFGTLPLSDLTVREDQQGKRLEGFYSKEHERFVKHDPGHPAALRGTYLLQLPDLPVLDCIGVAEKEGKPKYYYLNEYPLIQNFKAPVIKLNHKSSLELIGKLDTIHLDLLTIVKRNKGLKI